MASPLRFWAYAAFISAASGYAIGELPTQTVGYGEPFPQEPTEAPSMELLKRVLALGKKALTNTCTQWTLEGGGQPECYDGRTCLFYNSATDGYFYEGCGDTSVSYDWITECWPYTAKTGIPPVSQIYCPATAPDCGFYAFNDGDGRIYYNFGCSTTSYSSYANLVTAQGNSSGGGVGQTVVLASNGTSSITDSGGGSTIGTSSSIPVPSGGFGSTAQTSSSTKILGGPGATNTPTGQSPGSHSTKSKTPIGAIVGGVIGGIALIAFLAFLAWFVRHKRRDAAKNQAHEPQVQQQQGDAATAAALHNPNRISEIGGTMKPVQPQSQFSGAFAPAPQKSQGGENEKLMSHQVNEYPSPSSQSPPPMYTHPVPQQAPQQASQPAPQSPYPPSNYAELGSQNHQPARASLQPGTVSPVGTYNSDATELGGSAVGAYHPPASPTNAQSYMPPPQEMSGNAASPRQPRPHGGFDMSGAPMSEDYGNHELP